MSTTETALAIADALWRIGEDANTAETRARRAVATAIRRNFSMPEPAKPLSVALDDEALIEAHEDAVAERTRLRDVPMATSEFATATRRWEHAQEALRRRFAELKTVQEALKAVESLRDAAIRVGKVWEQSSHEQRARAEAAEAALAACRDKTIEECAVAFERLALSSGRQECCGIGVQSGFSPPECCGDPLLLVSDRDGAATIRALKTKEPTNG